MNYFKITDKPKVKTSELLKQCKEKFEVYSFYYDARLDKDFPPPKKAVTRYFAKTVEADENLKNKSANDLEKENVQGITLRERLIMELEYFNETGKHLDIDNITLCTGSRDPDGDVPSVGWGSDDREMYVDWYLPSSSSSDLRARAAVILDSLPLNPSDLESRVKSLEEDMQKIKKFLII